MVELTADRLVLVDQGTAVPYDGSMEDYIDFVLGRNQPKAGANGKGGKSEAKPAAPSWAEQKELAKQISRSEKAVARVQAQIAEIDAALAEPAKAAKALAGLSIAELGRKRASQLKELEAAEHEWLTLNEKLALAG